MWAGWPIDSVSHLGQDTHKKWRFLFVFTISLPQRVIVGLLKDSKIFSVESDHPSEVGKIRQKQNPQPRICS